jgi:hypothetical protein
MCEFIPCDDLGEFGQECGAGTECECSLTGEIEQAPRWSLPEEARQTVLVSATIRMTGAAFGARGIDLGLHFVRGEGRCVQRIELREGFAEPLGSRIASALLTSSEEVDKILHFRTLLRW